MVQIEVIGKTLIGELRTMFSQVSWRSARAPNHFNAENKNAKVRRSKVGFARSLVAKSAAVMLEDYGDPTPFAGQCRRCSGSGRAYVVQGPAGRGPACARLSVGSAFGGPRLDIGPKLARGEPGHEAHRGGQSEAAEHEQEQQRVESQEFWKLV